METRWLPEPIHYDGAQLRAHWIFEQTEIIGDAMVAFIGGADVNAGHMVDLEDVRAKAWIHSDAMLHFLVEHFEQDLDRMILRQRLLAAIVGEELRQSAPNAVVIRRGNDLYEGNAKLSVSIATVSPVSGLIHLGINVVSTNTPVMTKGLHDYDIAPAPFATKVMARYAEEIAGARHARAKVRSVT